MQMPGNCTGVQIHTAYVLLTIVVLKIPCRVVLSVQPTSCSFSHTPHSATANVLQGTAPLGGLIEEVLPKDLILQVQASQYKRGFPAVQPLPLQYARAWVDRSDAAMTSNLRKAEVSTHCTDSILSAPGCACLAKCSQEAMLWSFKLQAKGDSHLLQDQSTMYPGSRLHPPAHDHRVLASFLCRKPCPGMYCARS
jgi:hypothetical protein